ncbi:MAG TPA: RES domain-containing protein [Drouetiella sp.]|jgi:RES domain-containing protein
MFVYRICRAPYTALDGEGAKVYGGRWNSPGKPALYTASHLSLAALELLVHLDFDNLPLDLVWLKIEIPGTVSLLKFPDPVAPNEREAALYGDAWLTAKRSLGLIVPSAVLSVELNVIINPLHSEASHLRIVKTASFEFDDRLFKR